MNIEQVVELYKNQVYNLALHYVQNTEDAQEITQDVFVSVFQAADSFRGEAQLSTWIYRITVNRSLDFIRARKRKKRFGFLIYGLDKSDVGSNGALTDFDHPGIQLEHKESLQRLFRFINELPEKQKTVLILSKIERKSQNEVSEIMELSTKAVESLLHRAKLNLLKKIADSRK